MFVCFTKRSLAINLIYYGEIAFSYTAFMKCVNGLEFARSKIKLAKKFQI
jgi:hypothetical protein